MKRDFLSELFLLSYGFGFYLNDVFGRISELKRSEFVFVCHHELLVFAKTGTGGYKVTADHVFLHTLEIVALAVDGRLVENLGGFLE